MAESKPYINYNAVGVTGANLERFLETLAEFAQRKGAGPAMRWLTKLNPEVDRHRQMEYLGTDREYTRKVANRAVLGEYDHQPLPVQCECGDVAWYRATSSVLKCQGCGEAILDYANGYIEDLIERAA